MKNNNKGITLIALVITIIVLLILVGVTLAMISGESSIFTKAVTAKEDTFIAQAKEVAGVVVSELMADFYDAKYVQKTSLGTDEDTADKYIKKHVPDKEGEWKDWLEYSAGTFTILQAKTGNAKITGTIEAANKEGHIAAGYITWSDAN